MGMSSMGMPGMASSPMGGTAAPMMPNMLMVPRCTMKMEKCTGGMKIMCSCDDPTACSMMQNLCTMMQGGMCSCCCMLNGMMVYCCNLTMGMCTTEATDMTIPWIVWGAGVQKGTQLSGIKTMDTAATILWKIGRAHV